MGRDLEAAGLVGVASGVDAEHEHLVAEPVGDLGDDLGPGDRGGVDADLVGAGSQQPVDVLGVRTPPPTVSGMKTWSAVRPTTSNVVSRLPDDAVMSRKVSSSAPSAS